ncbi:MAG TPA: hypothetical protein ENK66_08865 [Arcobacter sp.]|nr:hypothetical protein [Arcobacter sp.]
MTYNALIDHSIDSIGTKIESYNGDNNTNHKKCDYIEILALLNNDELYNDDLLSRFFSEYSDRDNSPEEEQSEISDKHERELIDLFEILKYRQELYGEDYPFEIIDNMIKLKENLSHKQKLYIIFLCCANLTTFEKNLQFQLTDEFEHITYCAISQHLPNTFTVKKLGSNSDYTGNTRKKLKDLGRDINLNINNEQIDNIPLSANKEKGVDLIAWYNFTDHIPNTLIFLIQCACGQDTYHKIYEPKRYSTYFNFNKMNPIIALATPKSIVIKPNKIENESEVFMGDTLYFDRLRLMELIVDLECLNNINAFSLADRLISETTSVLD